MKSVTEYFRNTLIARSHMGMDYSQDTFATISIEDVENGFLNGSNLGLYVYDKEVIIALKTIQTEFQNSVQEVSTFQELTSVLFLPAFVSDSGQLKLCQGKQPWIPIEILYPFVEKTLSIGEMDNYDAFLSNHTSQREQIETWQDYLQYAKDMYFSVTQTKEGDNFLWCGEKKLSLDEKVYIFIDQSMNTTKHILQLYDDMLNLNKENALYARLTNTKIADKLVKEKEICEKKWNMEMMKRHKGQMGWEYSLSPSQREVMHCFHEMKEGDILAVSGPPGTGKTTLLQSIVADLFVDRAIKKQCAPVIVASSTNNQAVTNIIDSFGSAGNSENCLEERWITGAESFAVYFPSAGKVTDAKNKGYQFTNKMGKYFVDEFETKKNRKDALKKFKEKIKEYFGEYFFEEFEPVSNFTGQLHQRLCELETSKIKILNLIETIKGTTGGIGLKQYIDSLIQQKAIAEQNRNKKNNEFIVLEQTKKRLQERCEEWRQSYNHLPWYIRLFRIIPVFHNRILTWSYTFMKSEEVSPIEFLKRGMSINQIEEAYRHQIDMNDIESANIQMSIDKINHVVEAYEQKIKNEEMLVDQLITYLTQLEKDYKIRIFTKQQKQKATDRQFWYDLINDSNSEGELVISGEKVNNLLDRVRYAEFWLAVHYFESEWLQPENVINPVNKNQKHTTHKDVMEKRYHNLAMIAPCMVMTFFMLPSQFMYYESKDTKNHGLYNFIDLLIIDEAGQISPEIAACSFSLAKKALVVGDEQQIPPVWNIPESLDSFMASTYNVIPDREQYNLIIENGLNCANSSIMKVASLSCQYERYPNYPLFLSEHRRCYDEIAAYCNELVYDGHLIPCRKSAMEDKGNALKDFLPAIGYKEIPTETSQKVSCSRKNQIEAVQIAEWVKINFPELAKRYGKKSVDESKILGIITPFKAQVACIKTEIQKALPDKYHKIDIGTVHTFQGAERNVIIFSSVYGSKDGCFFIDANKSLMNVAVSRAKDCFLFFGELECLSSDRNTASGLLREFVENNEI